MSAAWSDDDVVSSAPAKAQAWSDEDVAGPATKTPDSFMSRVGTGLMDPIVGAAQLADKAINPIRQMISPGASSMEDVTRERDAEYNAPEGIDAARMAGNLLNPVTWAGGGAAGLSRGGAAAASGALQGLLTPAAADGNFAEQKVEQAGTGAVVGSVLSKALRGVTPTAEARSLMDQGVTLTPGQAAGSGSMLKRAEEYASSLPVAGHFIRNAQNRAVEEANVAAAQQVARMVDNTIKLGKPPREAIEQTRDAIGEAYEKGLAGINVPGFVPDAHLNKVVQGVASQHPMMESGQVAQMGRFVSGRLNEMIRNNNGTLTGPMLKQLDSEIGQNIRNFAKSTVAADKTAVPAWRDLQQSLREVIEMAQPDPAQAAQLKSANAAYRQLLALEKAMLPGNETFTPRRLKATLERMDIKGTPLNETAEAMSKTLPNAVPNSGTAERLMMGALPALLMGGGAGAQGLGFDTFGAGMMAAGAMGSRPGARLMTGNTKVQRVLQPYDAHAAAAAIAALRGRQRDE